jgi:hypothetical protein
MRWETCDAHSRCIALPCTVFQVPGLASTSYEKVFLLQSRAAADFFLKPGSLHGCSPRAWQTAQELLQASPIIYILWAKIVSAIDARSQAGSCLHSQASCYLSLLYGECSHLLTSLCCGSCLHSQASCYLNAILRINTKLSKNFRKCLFQATSIAPCEIKYIVPEVINDTEHDQW